jgi:hypothetical protein
MPPERTDDSYAIYSPLLNSSSADGRDTGRRWLIESSTAAISLDRSCEVPRVGSFGMNPREVVKAPLNRQNEWNEVLDDYDRHCHDVVRLKKEQFTIKSPIRLMNVEDVKKYHEGIQPPAQFSDAGLHAFSEAYFNPKHTLALVYQGVYCGSLCGNWAWVALERSGSDWRVLPWVLTGAVS